MIKKSRKIRTFCLILINWLLALVSYPDLSLRSALGGEAISITPIHRYIILYFVTWFLGFGSCS